jgi:phenylalanyl-tRNA synthetase beta chain
VGGLTRHQRERRLVADALVGAGLSEAITIPLVAEEDLTRTGASLDAVVRAANPLRAEESVLRSRILPGLLRAAATNATRGLVDVALFESGRVFGTPAPGALLPVERTHVAGVLTGTVVRRPVEADRPVDVHDATDAVRAVLDALELADVRLVDGSHPGFRPGAAAAVEVSGVPVGIVGELGTGVAEAFGAAAPAVAFELDLDALLDAPRRDRSFVGPSPYPPAVIDLAFVLDETVTAGELLATLRRAGGAELEEVRVFDEFRSDGLGAGRRSLAFRLRYRAADRTLTDQELGALRDGAIAAVRDVHGAELRA